MQGLCGIEAPRLEQLVRRGSTPAPAEVGAGTFTRGYALLDLVFYELEIRALLDIEETMSADAAKCEITETRISRSQQLRRECRDGTVMADADDREGYILLIGYLRFREEHCDRIFKLTQLNLVRCIPYAFKEAIDE